MKTSKFSSGFLVQDFDGDSDEDGSATISSGMVRLAPKILPYGAEQLARSATYLFAANGLKISGASAGINSKPEDRQKNIAAFLNDTRSLRESGEFLPYAGKGISEAELADENGNESAAENKSKDSSADPRAKVRLQDMGGYTLTKYATGVSAVTAMDELVGGIESKTVIIEGINQTELGALEEIARLGGKVIDSSAYETECDIFLVGSKVGAVDHELAEKLQIKALGSLHPIPYTTKALFVLARKGVIVPPDFLCLGGLVHSAWTHQGTDSENTDTNAESNAEAVLNNTREKTRELIQKTKELEPAVMQEAQKESAEPGPSLFLAGCKIAEDFLLTWRDQLPFGRPLA